MSHARAVSALMAVGHGHVALSVLRLRNARVRDLSRGYSRLPVSHRVITRSVCCSSIQRRLFTVIADYLLTLIAVCITCRANVAADIR